MIVMAEQVKAIKGKLKDTVLSGCWTGECEDILNVVENSATLRLWVKIPVAIFFSNVGLKYPNCGKCFQRKPLIHTKSNKGANFNIQFDQFYL